VRYKAGPFIIDHSLNSRQRFSQVMSSSTCIIRRMTTRQMTESRILKIFTCTMKHINDIKNWGSTHIYIQSSFNLS
jgi:hypothetical protein